MDDLQRSPVGATEGVRRHSAAPTGLVVCMLPFPGGCHPRLIAGVPVGVHRHAVGGGAGHWHATPMAFPAYPFLGGGRVSAKRLLKNFFAVWRNMCIFAAANVDRFVMIATT